jgi:hypothetical protein
MLREARFPDIKTFDQLDGAVFKGVSRFTGSESGLRLRNGAPGSWRSGG